MHNWNCYIVVFTLGSLQRHTCAYLFRNNLIAWIQLILLPQKFFLIKVKRQVINVKQEIHNYIFYILPPIFENTHKYWNFAAVDGTNEAWKSF